MQPTDSPQVMCLSLGGMMTSIFHTESAEWCRSWGKTQWLLKDGFM